MDITIIEEIDELLGRIRNKDYRLEEVSQIRLDLSVLLTMLSDTIGDVHEDQGRAEYERKSFFAERMLYYRKEEKKTAGDAEALATIDSADLQEQEVQYKAMYRRLENKRQALLHVCNALSAFGKNINDEDLS